MNFTITKNTIVLVVSALLVLMSTTIVLGERGTSSNAASRIRTVEIDPLTGRSLNVGRPTPAPAGGAKDGKGSSGDDDDDDDGKGGSSKSGKGSGEMTMMMMMERYD